MNEYLRMERAGIKAMRYASLITALILAVILGGVSLATFYWVKRSEQTLIWWVVGVSIAILILFIIIFTIVVPIYRYKVFRYRIDEHEILVRKGMWFIKTYQIPMFRIQNVDRREGPIMRKFGLATIELSTAGGNVDITLISKKQALKLKKSIRKQAVEEKESIKTELQEHD